MEQVKHQVDLRPQRISRIHLGISNTGIVTDWRSLYGTTVNGLPLRYGKSHKLEDGDTLVLSGLEVLIYRQIEWRPWHYLRPPELAAETPSAGWAVLVNGKRRVVLPIFDDEQFVTLRGGGGLSEDQADDAVLAVRRRTFRGRVPLMAQAIDTLESDGPEQDPPDYLALVVAPDQNYCSTEEVSLLTLQPLTDSSDLFETWIKEGDYTYRRIMLPLNQETVAIGSGSAHGIGEIIISTVAGPIQIVPTRTADVGEICTEG